MRTELRLAASSRFRRLIIVIILQHRDLAPASAKLLCCSTTNGSLWPSFLERICYQNVATILCHHTGLPTSSLIGPTHQAFDVHVGLKPPRAFSNAL